MDCFLFTGKAEKTDDSTLSDLSPMSSGVESGQQSPVSPEDKKNQKSIQKLWGKWVFERFFYRLKTAFIKAIFFLIWCVLSDIVWNMEISVGHKFSFYPSGLDCIMKSGLWFYWLYSFFFFFALMFHIFLLWFIGSEEHSQAVFLQTVLILTSSEGVSGPRPALDSPARAPVPQHGISAPTMQYT